ncbi:MAG: DNA-binding protein [Polaromonas sp.]|jgi:chromosome segregation ATPase|nr:DNA-binding protein [Polaromonas sp.]
MQSKSTRGVQQDEIWAAADALLKEGQRPTIERVRQKMGRGSPNTVSPMLEAWFASLGPRLDATPAQEETGQLPEAVWQSMTQLWDTAMRSAREQADQELVQSRQQLAEQAHALDVQKANLSREAQALSDRQSAVDQAADMARAHILELTSQLKESHTRMTRREGEVDEFRARLASAATQHEADRRRIDEEAQRHAEERVRFEERAAANERRLLGELDRARQGTKQAQLALAETERRSQAALKALELANQTLNDQLSQVQSDLQVMQQALVSANERSRELHDLLERDRTTTRDAFEQLNRRLAEAASEAATEMAHKNPTMALRSKRLSARKG